MGWLAQQQPWFERNRSILYNLQQIASQLGHSGMCSTPNRDSFSFFRINSCALFSLGEGSIQISHQVSSLSIGVWGWVVEKPLEKWMS